MKKQNPELFSRLATLKSRYLAEGFVILGVFGSVARGEETPESDIDLLYQVEAPFLKQYGGFASLSRLDKIKHELMAELGRQVDLASANTSNRVLKEEIERDIVYV